MAISTAATDDIYALVMHTTADDPPLDEIAAALEHLAIGSLSGTWGLASPVPDDRTTPPPAASSGNGPVAAREPAR